MKRRETERAERTGAAGHFWKLGENSAAAAAAATAAAKQHTYTHTPSQTMFKRRSSKDLSAKIGYDHVNGKASRNPSVSSVASTASAGVAPVSNIIPGHQKQSSFSSSSSYRKTTGMPSPEGDSGGATDTNSTGPSPLAAMKPAQQPQQQQQQQPAPATTTASTKAPSKTKPAPKAVAEPPSKSLVIGEGVLFEGTTEGCAAAVVGGKLVGTVKSRRLEITRAGRMEGTAYAETAEIAGTFEGNLTVTKALKVGVFFFFLCV